MSCHRQREIVQLASKTEETRPTQRSDGGGVDANSWGGGAGAGEGLHSKSQSDLSRASLMPWPSRCGEKSLGRGCAQL